jgi:fructose-1-phosphate kinase PfkB-like protein
VSRALASLGVKNVATGFLGGETGSTHKKLMNKEGLKNDFVLIKDFKLILFSF